MLCLRHDKDALRLHMLHKCVRNLPGQLFLKLQTPCKYFDCPGKLAKPHHLAVRDIGNMDFPEKGQHMMLADGMEGNVFFDYHVAVLGVKRLV